MTDDKDRPVCLRVLRENHKSLLSKVVGECRVETTEEANYLKAVEDLMFKLTGNG